jgi:hypothetical protein
MGQRADGSTNQHGTAQCARHGCQRSECRQADYRRRKRNALDLQRGISWLVPVHEVWAYLKELTEAGMSLIDIAEKSRVSYGTIKDYYTKRVAKVHRGNAEAIWAIPMPSGDYVPSGDMRVDATASRRRLQALGVRGFPRGVLATETGITAQIIGDIRDGRRRGVLLSTERAIAQAYDRLWNKDPFDFGAKREDVTVTRNRAAQDGWAPPTAWDDDEIGDPKARPRGVVRTSVKTA